MTLQAALKLLDVSSTTTEPDLKKAFRHAALRTHPDRRGGSESAFKEVQAAYELLLRYLIGRPKQPYSEGSYHSDSEASGSTGGAWGRRQRQRQRRQSAPESGVRLGDRFVLHELLLDDEPVPLIKVNQVRIELVDHQVLICILFHAPIDASPSQVEVELALKEGEPTVRSRRSVHSTSRDRGGLVALWFSWV